MTDSELSVMMENYKKGDPEAQFQVYKWALEQAAEFPEDDRWMALAESSLRAAAANGYGPAAELVTDPAETPADDTFPDESPAGDFTDEPVPDEAPDENQVVLDGWDEQPEQPPVSDTDAFFYESNLSPEEEPDEDDYWQCETPAGEDPVERAWKKVDAMRSVFREDDTAADPAADTAEKGAFLDKAQGLFSTLRQRFSTVLNEEDEPAYEDAEVAPSAAEDGEDDEPRESFSARLRRLLKIPADMPAETWKKIERGGIVIAALVLVLLVLLICSGRDSDTDTAKTSRRNSAEETEVLDEELTEATPAPTPTPTPEPFPSSTLVAEINNASTLSYRPLTEQYLSASASKSVSANGGLNLRSGPGSDYESIRLLSDSLTVTLYAEKDGWGLINAGGTWGWANLDYLR